MRNRELTLALDRLDHAITRAIDDVGLAYADRREMLIDATDIDSVVTAAQQGLSLIRQVESRLEALSAARRDLASQLATLKSQEAQYVKDAA